MKVNNRGKQILAWILIFAMFMTNLTFDAAAQEKQSAPPETQNETAGTVETEPQCTCEEGSDVHSGDCPLYQPTFLEKLLALQSLKELYDAMMADTQAAAAMTAEDLAALKNHVEVLFAALTEASEDEQGYYAWLMGKVQPTQPEEQPDDETQEQPDDETQEQPVDETQEQPDDETQEQPDDETQEQQTTDLTEDPSAGSDNDSTLYADAASLENFEYTLDAESGNVLLSKYIGDHAQVIVAPVYIVDDLTYDTVLDSNTVFQGNTRITSVKLYAGVKFSNNTAAYLFNGCSALQNADLEGINTTGVTDMSYLFGKCEQLTTVNMTGIDTSQVTTMYAMFTECYKLANLIGYEVWNTSSLENMFWMFNKVQAMEIIDLHQWDLSQVNNSTWCFQNNYAKQLILPDNLKTMSAGFLNHASYVEGSTFTIPAGVQKIGYAHTIYDFATNDFVEFIVAEGNENYVAIDGILYSADGKEMLAVPRNKPFENNTYVIPEGVEFLGELSFSQNYNIHTVVLPNSYEIVQSVPLHDSRYIIFEDIGNLNASNSLTIAIYVYTGITDYAVKDDNPRYASVDGIIYSKDMSTVIAIPTRYNKVIDIPEGVTTWNTEAIWSHSGTDQHMTGCLGVHIPASLTDIAQDQLDKLNRLSKAKTDFVVTVDPENPVYQIDEQGDIVATATVVARNEQTRNAYVTLSEALENANDDETITLLTDIVLNNTLTVSSNVTIQGAHSIIRADNFANTLFAVSSGATLTLDGNLTIDGGNEWVFNKATFMADMKTGKNGHSYATLETGAPIATAAMFSVNGTVNVNHVTIQNSVARASLFDVKNGGILNLNDGALIRNNYGYSTSSAQVYVVGYVANTGLVTINGNAKICDNYGPNANGVLFDVAGTMVINDGEICSNYGASSGMIMLHQISTTAAVRPNLTMNGGSICHNCIFPGGWGCVVYVHGQGIGSVFTMNGGYIGDNEAYLGTSICANGTLSDVYLLGGTVEAPAGYNSAHPEALFYGNTTVGEDMEIEGEFLFWGSSGKGFDLLFANDGDIHFKTIQFSDKNGYTGEFTVSGDGTWTFDVLQVTKATTVLTLTEGTFLGDLSVTSNASLTITGGTYSDLEAIKYLADGLGLLKNDDGTYTVTDQVAEVGGVVYNSVAAAEAAAGEGDTINLLAIAPVKTSVTVDHKTVINLNGNDIYATVADVYPVIRALADVTVQGEGSVDAKTFGSGYAYIVGDSETSGKLTVKSGSHYGVQTVALVTKGTLNIVGGYYEATPYEDSETGITDCRYTLRSDITNFDNGSAIINVTGGTFYGFDPDSNLSQDEETDFVPEKHNSVNDVDANTWTVSRIYDYIARVESTGELYESLAEAVAAASANGSDTVTLLKDFDLNETVTVTGTVTIDGAGYTITRGDSYTGTLFNVASGAGLTMDNITIDGGNAWEYKKTGDVYDLQAVVDDYARQAFTLGQFIEYESGAPKAQKAVFTIYGSMEMKDVLVQNHVGSDSIVEIGSNGSLTTNEETEFFHNVGVNVIDMTGSSTFNMNGSTIRQNVGTNHGGCVRIWNGTMTMNGGTVEENFTLGQGSFVRLDGGKLIVNSGDIQDNLALPFASSGNNAGAAIDCKYGHVEMNGGTIQRNYGHYVGGINHIGNSLTITGGTIVDNVALVASNNVYHDDLWYAATTDKPAKISGGIFGTEIYSACTSTDIDIVQGVTPLGCEEFVYRTDENGEAIEWEVAKGWMITFLDDEGNQLQYGPVREGEIPVFESEVAPREGYLWGWDKDLVPATKTEIYTMVWKPIVAEVVNGDTHKGYFATLQGAVDAAENGDTVRILLDISLTSKVTVSGKNITLDGNNLTITRGKDAKDKWYTGTLISVSSGASLTVDGKLTIDGGNHWVHKIIGDQYAFVYTAETYVNKTGYADLTYFITSEAGAPVANQDLITVAGELVLKEVTISNHWGQNACNVMHIYGTGSVTMNEKTMIRHNVSDGKGAVASMDVNSNFVMNGGEVSDNVAEWHGGCVENNGGYMVMNGGSINHNYTTDGMGSAIFLYDTRSHSQIERPNFLMNGGDISNNISLPGPNGNANGSAIYARNGIMEMHGGIIHHNYGKNVGGIIVNSAKLTITGGAVAENVDLLGNNVYHDLAGSANTKISGGIFSHDVNEYCETEYVAVPQKTKYKGEFTCRNQAVNGWEKKSIAVAENFTAWVVDKTSINSMLYENQEFGQKHEQENPIISNDSAYTVVYELIHFYHKTYLVPELKFNQNLPVNTTIILRYTDDNEKEYPYWSDPAVEQVSYWGYVVTKTTDTIPLSAFTRMGSTEDDRHVIGDRDLTLRFVVDFSQVDGGFDVDSLDTSLVLISAAAVSDQEESYYQSGAINRNVTENVALINTIFSLENTDSNYLTQTIRYDFTAAVSAGETFGMSRWDYRERALLVTIPNLPEDARLIIGNSVYVPYVPGCYIIPVGDNFSGELSMTLTSNMFPKDQMIYTATCWLYAAESTADSAPLNGRLLSEPMECLFISPDRMASVDVTQENNKHLFTNEESIIVTVEHILSAQYEVVVQLEFKDEEGNYVLLNQTGNQRRDTYMFSLNDCTPGTYRIVAIVKHKTDGRVVTHAPYYFIVE